MASHTYRTDPYPDLSGMEWVEETWEREPGESTSAFLRRVHNDMHVRLTIASVGFEWLVPLIEDLPRRGYEDDRDDAMELYRQVARLTDEIRAARDLGPEDIRGDVFRLAMRAKDLRADLVQEIIEILELHPGEMGEVVARGMLRRANEQSAELDRVGDALLNAAEALPAFMAGLGILAVLMLFR